MRTKPPCLPLFFLSVFLSMASIVNLVPTTELEAVNAMLAAIGESAIEDVDSATQADVAVAVTTLRDTARQVQSLGWKFNSEWELALAPTEEDFEWTEPDASTYDIDIWTIPTGIVRWNLSPRPDQVSLDVTQRPSKQYEVADAPVLVIYDRDNNRDGFTAGERDFLYIDAVWLFNFEQLPESARAYIAILATKRFIQAVQPDGKTDTTQDEMIALRNLKREQGEEDEYNMFDSPSVARVLFDRPTLNGPFARSRK